MLTHPGTQFLNPVDFESQRARSVWLLPSLRDQHDLDFKSLSLFPAVVLALGVCLLLRRSIGIRRSRKTLVTHIVVLPNYQEDEATLRETPDVLVHSPSAGRCIDILLATDAFENRNTQDKGSCLQRKKATYHPPGIPDQWAFRQLWKKYGVELHQQCVHEFRRC